MATVYHKQPFVGLCRNGFLIETGFHGSPTPPKTRGAKRGNITSFSYESAKRLRHALLTADVPDAKRYGITFTVPVSVEDWQADWLLSLKRFWFNIKRWSGFKAAIYRVELQQRGMPHLHCIMWGDDTLPIIANVFWVNTLSKWLINQTITRNHGYVNCRSQADAMILGITVKSEALNDNTASLRYLFDHTSKKKVVQLGYHGKQWGIIGKQNITWLEEDLHLSYLQIVALIRLVRRWTRTHYKRNYRGRLSRLRLYRGKAELWASEELRGRILGWLEGLKAERTPGRMKA